VTSPDPAKTSPPASERSSATGASAARRAARSVARAASRARRFGGRAPRWLRIVVYVTASAFVVYLLAANILLRTHLLRGWISADESELRLDYRSAWSAYPGHVSVRDLSLRYQDRNVQMLILIEGAKLNVDLFALTKRAFEVRKLAAEGVTFRMRQKVETMVGQEERVRAFPPIDGFADPPVEHKAPKPPGSDDVSKLWTMEIRDVSASLREVWTMEFRYRGDGEVRGGFCIKPEREAWVLPSVMRTAGGVFSLGDRDLIRGGGARLDAEISAFDVRGSPGVEVLRHVSGAIHQQGELVLPSIAATYLPKGKNVDVTRGTGPVSIDMRIDRGVLEPSSRVTFHTDDVLVNAHALAVQADLDLLARVDTEAGKSTVIVETTLAHATGAQLEIRGARAMVDLGNADLAAPFGIARASGEVASAHSSDLRIFQPFAPENTSFAGGSATLAARAELRAGALEGRIDLALDEARMAIGTFAFTASGKAWTNMASADIAKAIAFPGAGLDLHGVALALESGQTSGLWVRASLANAKLSTTGAAFDTDIAVDAGPGDRTLALFTRMASLPDIAAAAASGTRLAASLHVRVRPDLIALTVTKAENGPLEVHGKATKRADSPLGGAFLMSVGPLRAGLRLQRGDVSVVPLASGAWLDEASQALE
jgi:hypothetical protein